MGGNFGTIVSRIEFYHFVIIGSVANEMTTQETTQQKCMEIRDAIRCDLKSMSNEKHIIYFCQQSRSSTSSLFRSHRPRPHRFVAAEPPPTPVFI